MNKLHLIIWVFGMLWVLTACAPPKNFAPEATPSQTTTRGEPAPSSLIEDTLFIISKYDSYVADMVEQDDIVGASVAVIYRGEIVLVKGYGWRDVENQLPVTPETLFHIASTQKSMTAMLVAILVDEGVLTWDTPLVEVYPAFALAEGGDEITLRHLLNMTSGIPDDAEDQFVDQGNETATDLWPFLATLEPLGGPGEVYSYSNISASLAGYAAVLATNPQATALDDEFGVLLTERVLRPIGMQTAAFSIDVARQNPNHSKPYWVEQGEWIPAAREDFADDTLTPSGVVKASAAEMALYIQTQLNQGVAPNGTRIVSAENMAEMWQPGLENYGLGWETVPYESVDIILHEGAYDNYLSVVGFAPKLELGFVVFTNSADASDGLIADAPWVLVDLVSELE